MKTRASSLVTFLRPIVWFARCIGQLPVIWNARLCQWQVAPWYHPQSIYFTCLSVFRLLVYGTKSYALLTSPTQFSSSPTQVATFALECLYIWLRMVLAPYGLVVNLRLVGKAIKNLEEVDSILDSNNEKKIDWKAYTCVIVMSMEMIIAVPLMVVFTRYFITWYNKFIPSYQASQLIVTWYFMDVVMEMTALAQFCISSIILKQRINAIRKHLKQFRLPSLFQDGSSEILPESLKGQDHSFLKQLRCAYIILRQASTEICKSFGLTVLAISLGETIVLTNNLYGLARRLMGLALAKQKIIFLEEYYFTATMLFHSTFLLGCLFRYADQITDEVEELQMDLDLLTVRTTQNSAEIRNNLCDLHQSVFSSPLEKITAAKFYDVGRRSIPAILGAILTYFVVLVQFEGSEKLESNCPCNGSVSGS